MIFSHNCQLNHRRLESLGHFNVLFNGTFLELRSHFVDLTDAKLFLEDLLFYVYISIIFASTLWMCVMCLMSFDGFV